MMIRNLFKSITNSVGIGSFIYLLSAVFIEFEVVKVSEILSVWIASSLIGVANILYYTKMANIVATIIQFSVGVIAFTVIAVLNEWITISLINILEYALGIFIIMLIIFVVFYLLSLYDSKKINEKLNAHKN